MKGRGCLLLWPLGGIDAKAKGKSGQLQRSRIPRLHMLYDRVNQAGEKSACFRHSSLMRGIVISEVGK